MAQAPAAVVTILNAPAPVKSAPDLAIQGIEPDIDLETPRVGGTIGLPGIIESRGAPGQGTQRFADTDGLARRFQDV